MPNNRRSRSPRRGGRGRAPAVMLLPHLLAALSLIGLSGCRGGAEIREEHDSAQAAEEPVRLKPAQLQSEVVQLRKKNEQLKAGLDKLVPKDPYIVINTTLNHLYLRKGTSTVLDARCSTGSNTQLIEAGGKRRWFFSTPRGVHAVKQKMLAPVWVKPDWAFIEDGEPIPGKQAEERFQEGFLGKYGLYFGDGYLIHGTLFQRFLGQSVTHGCVRLGDEDLEQVYQNAKVGTKIYIY